MVKQYLRFPFDEEKASQVAAILVSKRGGSLKYLHLMKMLYTIDRTALAKWGQPVSGGRYCSMTKGPVISEILDLIKGKAGKTRGHFWPQHLQTKGFDISLKKSAGSDRLSKAELDIIDTVFVMLGNRDRWDVVQWTHDEFKEWKDPGTTSAPIAVEEILKAVGKTAGEINEIATEAAYYGKIDTFLAR